MLEAGELLLLAEYRKLHESTERRGTIESDAAHTITVRLAVLIRDEDLFLLRDPELQFLTRTLDLVPWRRVHSVSVILLFQLRKFY